jgi:hypothetical protein
VLSAKNIQRILFEIKIASPKRRKNKIIKRIFKGKRLLKIKRRESKIKIDKKIENWDGGKKGFLEIIEKIVAKVPKIKKSESEIKVSSLERALKQKKKNKKREIKDNIEFESWVALPRKEKNKE